VSGSRPLIGISAYAEQARWGVWDLPAVLVPRAYVDGVRAAGGVPVVLPPLPGVVEEALARLDGLLLAGGADIAPSRYGAEPDPATGAVREDRDAAEAGLISGAVGAGLPVLGVCRGMQLLNVVRGGTLVQHLPDVVGHSGHAPEPGVFARHPVTVQPGTRLATALARSRVTVPTYHHQGLDRLGGGLLVSARADDGTAEAVEDPDLPFCVAVQWHPEMGDDPALFRALVSAAAGHGQ
jgi:putative glutamine amidotransferase